MSFPPEISRSGTQTPGVGAILHDEVHRERMKARPIKYRSSAESGVDGEESTPVSSAARDQQAKHQAADTIAALPEQKLLSGRELKNTAYLQNTLINLLPGTSEILKARATKQESQDNMEALVKAVQRERADGVFGNATRRAYRQYTDALEILLPVRLQELDSLMLPMPTKCPIELPRDHNGRAISPNLYRAMISADLFNAGSTIGAPSEVAARLHAYLKIDHDRVPGDIDLDKLDDAHRWLEHCRDSIGKARGQLSDRSIEQAIKQMHPSPVAWLDKQGMDQNTWRRCAMEMIALTFCVRNYVDGMESLSHAGFKCDFPPGTLVERDEQGNLKGIKLDLPTDLRLWHPANRAKIDVLMQWLDENGARIDKIVAEKAKVKERPEAILQWGDQEVHGLKGRFNSSGQFVALVNPKNFDTRSLHAGESLKDLNLVEHRFDVTHTADGKIKVSQSVQAQEVPPWGYQNLIRSDVGQKMQIDEKTYDSDDFVPINTGSRIEIVQAKNLEAYKLDQQVWHYGGMALTATMDGAMVISAALGGAAALTAMRAADLSLRLTAGEAVQEIGINALRFGVGALGLLNNAGARDFELGQQTNMARGFYFLGDVALGLGPRQGLSAIVKRLAGESEALPAAAKVQEALNGLPLAAKLKEGTDWAFLATERIFPAVIGHDLIEQFHEIKHLRDRSFLDDAAEQTINGRLRSRPEKGCFDRSKPDALEAARLTLDRYCAILTDHQDESTREEVGEILGETRRLMGVEFSQKDRQAYVNGLLKMKTFDGETIKELELASDQQLTDQDLSELRDPDQSRNYSMAVQKIAAKGLGDGANPNVQAARAIAMFYLTRDANGRLPETLGETTITVPLYEFMHRYWSENIGQRTERCERPEHSSVAQFKPGEIIKALHRDLTKAPRCDLKSPTELGTRGMVTGELLYRLGAVSAQAYAAVLQDVLTDPNSSPTDKLRAMADANSPRIATILESMRPSSEAELASMPDTQRKVALARSTDPTCAKSLINTLETIVAQDKDPDVRAVAAAILFGSKEGNSAKRGRFLADLNRLSDRSPQEPGTFAHTIEGEKGTSAHGGTAKEREASARGGTAGERGASARGGTAGEREASARGGTAGEREASARDGTGRAQTCALGDTEKTQRTLANNLTEMLAHKMKQPIPELAGVTDWSLAFQRQDEIRSEKLHAALALASLTDGDDGKGQSAINEVLVDCLNPVNLSLSLKVIDSLTASRLKQLRQADPEGAATVQKTAVDLFETPGLRDPALNAEQQRDRVQLLGQMKSLLEDKDWPETESGQLAHQQCAQQRERLAGKLKAALDPTNDCYAEYYDDIRQAAISTLADFGCQSALNLIRGKLTSAKTLTVSERQIPAGESDASVRLAAVRACERLQDPMLHDVILDLIAKESDPTVASAMREASLLGQRLPEQSVDYKKIYESTLDQLLDPAKQGKYPELMNFGSEDAVKWLKSNYPLLRNKRYQETRNNAVTEAHGRFSVNLGWGLDFSGFNDRSETQARSKIDDQRNSQFDQLASKAQGSDLEAQKAKMALYYVMIRCGEPLADDTHTYNNGEIIENSKEYWEERTARALAACCTPGTGGREIAAWCVASALTGAAQLDQSARSRLLEGWEEFGQEALAGRNSEKPMVSWPTLDQVASVTCAALQSELKRPAKDQCDWYQQFLIHDLGRYKDRLAEAVLRPLSTTNKTGFESVKKQAKQVLSDLCDSVAELYQDSPTDLLSKPEERVQRLKTALSSNDDTERTIREIFVAYKGYKPANAANDPGLPYLQIAMNYRNSMVRLAAARVVAEAGLDKSSAAHRQMMELLSDLALNGEKQRYRQEASAVLQAALGRENHLEMALGDRRKLVLTKEAMGGVSVLEYNQGLRTAMAGPTGATIKLVRARDGQVTSFTTPEGLTYSRKPGMNGTYPDVWNREGSKEPAWQMAGPTCYSDGSIFIADKDFEYIWKRDGTFEQRSGERKLENGASLRFISGKLAEINYVDSPINPVKSRTLDWADGAVSLMVTYRRDNPHPSVITREKDEEGKYTNNYKFSCQIYDRPSGQWVSQSNVYPGKLEISKDGHYSWIGDDGYREAQDMEGPLCVWRDASDGPSYRNSRRNDYGK